jgi:hypothetical protein
MKGAMALVVSGHARSGTTLMWRLLQSHPAVGLTLEFGCFLHAGKRLPAYATRTLVRWLRSREPALLRDPISGEDPPRSSSYRCIARFFDGMRGSLSRRIGVEEVETGLRAVFPDALHVGDKYPYYVFCLERLTRMEDLQVIAMQRDCRDVTASVLRAVRTVWRGTRWARQLTSAGQVAERWIRAQRSIESNRDRITVVAYEDLVRAPSVELARLAEMLEIDPQGFHFDAVRTDSIGKFKSYLAPAELEQVEIALDSADLAPSLLDGD